MLLKMFIIYNSRIQYSVFSILSYRHDLTEKHSDQKVTLITNIYERVLHLDGKIGMLLKSQP